MLESYYKSKHFVLHFTYKNLKFQDLVAKYPAIQLPDTYLEIEAQVSRYVDWAKLLINVLHYLY